MCAQIVHCFFMSECLGSLVRGMLFLHQLPFSWWRHPVGIHLLVVGVCAHAPVRTHTPIHKGESGPPRVQGLRRPLCSAAANQDHLLPCFSCPVSPPFSFSFFLPGCFHPLPFLSGLWQLCIILFRDTAERCMCVMWGARRSVLQRSWGGLPQSDWWGRCRLCSLIHHILYLGFREGEKEKGGQEGVFAPPKISDRWARRAFSTPLSPCRNRHRTLVTQHHSAVSALATKDR